MHQPVVLSSQSLAFLTHLYGSSIVAIECFQHLNPKLNCHPWKLWIGVKSLTGIKKVFHQIKIQ